MFSHKILIFTKWLLSISVPASLSSRNENNISTLNPQLSSGGNILSLVSARISNRADRGGEQQATPHVEHQHVEHQHV